MRILRRLASVLFATVLFLLTIAGVSAAGLTATMQDVHRDVPQGVMPPQGWPDPASAPAGRLRVAVVAGASGSVISDVLAPYEVFASSPAFFVYTVSTVRTPVPLFGGPALLPDHTLAEVESSVDLAPDVVVVPAVGDATGPAEAPLRGWITRQAERGARVLGVCTGSELLAAAGVLDSRRAASHFSAVETLRQSYPKVSWVRGQRYVQDGPITTTAGVTSGIPGALRLVEQLAGAPEAERVGKAVAYPGWSLDAPTNIPVQGIAATDLPMALSFALPWLRPTVDVALTDGIGEIDVAAAFEVYNMSAAASAVAIAAQPTITTRHGVVLLATKADAAAPRSNRIVVPGGGFDAALRDLAGHADTATARAAAKYIEFPSASIRQTGDGWPWRPTALLALTLAVAIVVGLLQTLIRLATRRRRAAATGAAAGAAATVNGKIDATDPLVKT